MMNIDIVIDVEPLPIRYSYIGKNIDTERILLILNIYRITLMMLS